MEKIVKIGDKDIVLRANAMNLIIYQQEFKEDMFLAKNDFLQAYNQATGTLDLRKINSLTILKMVWTMAKTADQTLSGFTDWIASLEEVPVVELYQENLELFLANMFTGSPISLNRQSVEEQGE